MNNNVRKQPKSDGKHTIESAIKELGKKRVVCREGDDSILLPKGYKDGLLGNGSWGRISFLQRFGFRLIQPKS